MAKNKMSIWAVIILIATILSLIVLVSSIVLAVAGIPTAMEAAKQEASTVEGISEADINLAVGIAVGAIIVALVFVSIFDVLKIIGGFMFSLKGRWGIFCIVVSILSLIGSIWSLSSNISNHGAIGTIATSIIGLLLDLLLVIACFKHHAEVK